VEWLKSWFGGSAESERKKSLAQRSAPTFELRSSNATLSTFDFRLSTCLSPAAQDFDAFRKFANAAKWEDAGDSAAREHLSYPVAHLVEAVVGAGPWQPDPDAWKEGVEKGQFSLRKM
jgi:hypothetical protein